VAGSAEAMRRKGRPLGLLWIDAHADMNTPESSPSGNVHGMPLACILGKGPGAIVNIGGFTPKIDPARCAIVGLRNLDEREKDIVRESGVHAFTMKDIDRRGMAAVVDEALSFVTCKNSALHVSFDMDSVDPSVSPGVGTPVRGGLSYREAHLIMEMAADTQRLIALDMVEVNPILDHENSTAVLGCELILSALGKKIL
jgi:arginase